MPDDPVPNESMPPEPLNGAGVRPEDGPQDVPQEPGSAVDDEDQEDDD